MIFSNAYPYKPVGQSMETLGLISSSRIILKIETGFERGLVFTFTRDLSHIASL